MPEYKVILTWESIYDITDILDYIEERFGRERADQFQVGIKTELKKLEYMGGIFGKTHLMYRGYTIHKKPFPPSIVFYILKGQEVHVLRILREEQNWEQLLRNEQEYSY